MGNRDKPTRKLARAEPPKFPSQEVRDVLKWAFLPSAILAGIFYLMLRSCYL
jgi:hypothetical protein